MSLCLAILSGAVLAQRGAPAVTTFVYLGQSPADASFSVRLGKDWKPKGAIRPGLASTELVTDSNRFSHRSGATLTVRNSADEAGLLLNARATFENVRKKRSRAYSEFKVAAGKVRRFYLVHKVGKASYLMVECLIEYGSGYGSLSLRAEDGNVSRVLALSKEAAAGFNARP
jgi:hypothetical protein